jgi:hypothetical protein
MRFDEFIPVRQQSRGANHIASVLASMGVHDLVDDEKPVDILLNAEMPIPGLVAAQRSELGVARVVVRWFAAQSILAGERRAQRSGKSEEGNRGNISHWVPVHWGKGSGTAWVGACANLLSANGILRDNYHSPGAHG